MLNRRILRIKAFKVLYSYAENPQMTLKEAENELGKSCEATRDLYLFMLAIISPLTKEAKNRIEIAQSKFNPTDEEKNPNMKFVLNSLAPLFDNDPDFRKLTKKKKLEWGQYDVLLRNLYDSIVTKEYYQKYMASEINSIKEDADLFVKIFEEEFIFNEDLQGVLEDLSLYWLDDLDYALTYCCKTLEEIGRGKSWNLPPLYKSEMLKHKNPGLSSDKDFVSKLLRSAYAGYDKYFEKITKLVPQWDSDRLFVTDMVLIIMGLAEMNSFPSIPLRVSFNEYVEISKLYSTPKSSSFVNGLLDKIVKEMQSEGELSKS